MPQQKTAPSRVLVIISTIVVALVLLLPSTGQADDLASTTSYVVRGGDSLWLIAETLTTPGDDVRETVAAIRDLNGFEGSVIIPGQRIRVPASATDADETALRRSAAG